MPSLNEPAPEPVPAPWKPAGRLDNPPVDSSAPPPDRDAPAADWPTWRFDARRSAATEERLPDELHSQWERRLPELAPAWPN